jgi:putative RecB family exonuclease
MSDELSGVRTMKPHVSASQLESYCRCPEAYRRRYIEREVVPPGIALVKGKGFHAGAEHNMRQKIESRTDLPSADIVGCAVAAFEQGQSEIEGFGTVEIGAAKDSLVSLVEIHAKEQAPEYQPVMVEQSVKIELPNATRDLLGVIDLADERKIVTDFKTAGKKKSQGEADCSVQLSVYAVGYHALTGEPPNLVQLDVLVSGKKKTTRQVIQSTRDSNDIQALANRIESVTNAIDAGSFPPATPGAWWCSKTFCGYWRSCRYVNSERKELSTETEE